MIQITVHECSNGTGANRCRKHGSSGVHKDPDNDPSVNMPSRSDGARSGRSGTHSMPSGRGFREGGPPSARRLTHPQSAGAPSMHDIPLGNTTSTNRSLDGQFRGSPPATGDDKEPSKPIRFGRVVKAVQAGTVWTSCDQFSIPEAPSLVAADCV